MKKFHPINVQIGSRLRLIRIIRGLSQKELAQKLGLTYQQIQKYERGQDNLYARRIYEISRILEVPETYFYAGLDVDYDLA